MSVRDVGFAFDTSAQGVVKSQDRREIGLIALDLRRLAFVVLMGLRASFAVGIATIVYRQPTIFRLIPFFSWLLILAVEKATMPVTGMLMRTAPALIFATAIVYIAAAIASAYSARGNYVYLSGVLIFIFGFIGAWPISTGASTTLLFFPGALVILEYTNLGGNLLIRHPVSLIGNALALLLWLTGALCIMASLVVPLFAFWMVKKKLISTAALCAALTRAQQGDAKHLYSHLAAITAMRSQIEANLEFVKCSLPLVQAELFFADISGYRGRYSLLCDASAGLTQCSSPPADETDAQFFETFIFECQSAPMLEKDENADGRGLKRLFQSYQARPWWKWNLNMSLIKLWMGVLFDSWLPRSNSFESAKDYFRSFEFRKRLLNTFLAAGALTFASLFVLIKSWKDFFFHPTWPAIVVAFVWKHEFDLKNAGNRLLGTIIGGMLSYTVLVIADIRIFDYSKMTGILVGFAFLFRVLYARNPSLGSTSFLVTTLLLFEPPLFAFGDREKWLFERLFLNFLGVLIILFFQLISYLVYLPAWQAKQYMVMSLETFIQILQSIKLSRDNEGFQRKLCILEARLDHLEHAIESAEGVPLFIHSDIRASQCLKVLHSFRQLRQSLILESLERGPCISAAPYSMLTWAKETLENGIAAESSGAEEKDQLDRLSVAAAHSMEAVLELAALSHKSAELRNVMGSQPFGEAYLEGRE